MFLCSQIDDLAEVGASQLNDLKTKLLSEMAKCAPTLIIPCKLITCTQRAVNRQILHLITQDDHVDVSQGKGEHQCIHSVKN